MSRNAIWTCKDGRKLRVRDMTDQHLLNTIAMLERNYSRCCLATALSAWSYSADAPDGAAMCAESAAEEAMDNAETLDGIEEEYPIYKHLIKEMQARGLQLKP